MSNGKRVYVLDTNVLMHDPAAIFKFKKHDIFIPMMVLEELDKAKKGTSDASRNARQASRFLNDLIGACGKGSIDSGVRLSQSKSLRLSEADSSGRLFFQTVSAESASGLNTPDNQIIASALQQMANRQSGVVLVSKDINMRIKASIAGLPSEDYENDRALDDFSMLFTGYAELPLDFWGSHDELRSWNEKGFTYYEVKRSKDDGWYLNQFLCLPSLDMRVVSLEAGKAVLQVIRDYGSSSNQVWGISAKNREQNFAINALMDPSVDFVTLLGTAGTGKTLLALAAGLTQVMDKQLYGEIIMTRATVSVGEDIGFLPGTEEEKMTPWMGALTDNLEVLVSNAGQGAWGRAATSELIASRIKIRSMNFMRGRTFLKRWVIVDEAQNLTPKQMKTLITRAGPGTKIVCMGNVEQIDTPYITETTSGLTYAVDRFKDWKHSAHITLRRGERSRLADYASEKL